MATSTSLITFHVRVPPSTRNVCLYGSWDNFKAPYTMQRDSRIGREHWSGCHTFSDIICDGDPSGRSRSRNGGLKMGGTYWYYYKLDNETEFYNSAEPSTTACPLLPGQLVNVLHMPVVLSGNRSRNPSVSSTSSDRRTMNPEDKFSNPRPAPPPAKMCRLNTSPTSTELPTNAPWVNVPLVERSAKFMKLPRKASLDAFNPHSQSRTNGLREAFRIRTSRSQSPNPLETRKNEDISSHPSHHRSASFQSVSRCDKGKLSPPTTHNSPRDLLLRSHSNDTVPVMSSFQQHRQNVAKSRDQPAFKSPLYDDDMTPVAPKVAMMDRKWPLDTLKESAPAQNKPTSSSSSFKDHNVQILDQTKPDLGKRLPTLPNTPSSAYPASIVESSERFVAEPMEILQSHFSTTTIDTEIHARVLSLQSLRDERSHFSFFSDATDIDTSTSTQFQIPDTSTSTHFEMPDTSASTHFEIPDTSTSTHFDIPDTSTSTHFEIPDTSTSAHFEIPNTSASTLFEGLSPMSEVSVFEATEYFVRPGSDYELPSENSQMTVTSISSDGTNTPSTSYNESENEAFTSINKKNVSYAMKMQHYSLPDDEYASTVTLKGPKSNEHLETNEASDDNMGHSESMKRLLNELSYLSDLIQQ